MTAFDVPALDYDSFMGRYSRPLAERFADFAGLDGAQPGLDGAQRVLDVGCGPGALTGVLVDRLGAGRVSAAEPSERFAAACRERYPGADVRVTPAETLPWQDATFGVALAQLVLPFMDDAPAGAAEMRRVVRPGGTVAACAWDQSGGMRMLRVFWEAVRSEVDDTHNESRRLWSTPAELEGLWAGAGLEQVQGGELTVEAGYADFDDFWNPFLAGVGPAGAYCAGLDEGTQERVRDRCRRLLGDPQAGFTLPARAWAVRGRVPAP